MRASLTRISRKASRTQRRKKAAIAEQHRRRAHREQRQLPVDAEDRHQDEAQADDVADQADEARGEHLVQRLDVAGEPGHEPPHRRAVEERRRQRQHVPVDAHAQVVHPALADELREVDLREAGAVLPDQRREVERGRADRGPASRPTAMCSSIAFLSRYGCATSQQRDHRQQRDRHASSRPVRPDVAEDPAEQRPVERLAEQLLGRPPRRPARRRPSLARAHAAPSTPSASAASCSR